MSGFGKRKSQFLAVKETMRNGFVILEKQYSSDSVSQIMFIDITDYDYKTVSERSRITTVIQFQLFWGSVNIDSNIKVSR